MNHLIKIFIVTLFFITKLYAQTPIRVVFEDNFGNPPSDISNPTNNSFLRQRWDYMPTDVNTFVFANPNAKNITNPGGENSWPEAKHIDNNFYAVVGPKYIYKSINATISGMNGFWNNLEKRGDATTGHNGNGGALIINAGTTLSSFNVGVADLRPGRYYKLTYKLFVENGIVRVKQNIISPSGNTKLISVESPDNGQNSSIGNWVTQTYWFYLPTTCSTDNYYVALENSNSANQGNDYAVDDVKLEEYTSAPATTFYTISCNIPEPIANEDQSLLNKKGNSVSINVYNNDYLSNKTTKANSSNSTFVPLVPIGGYVHPYNQRQIVVNGEGIWSYELNGDVKFTPNSGFSGNPTPLSYRFTDNNSKGSSNIAKILITYTGNLTANADSKVAKEGETVIINILENDINVNGTAVIKDNVNTIYLINPFSLIENTGSMVIKGEGTWSIDNSSKNLVFTPETGFKDSPTPIQYYFTDANGNKSNKESVVIDISKTSSETCTAPVNGSDFEVRDGQSKEFTMSAADFGFQFDIYELDNSFNLTINGVQLASKEIQFQRNLSEPQNIRFKDGTSWGGKNVGNIWTLKGTKNVPLVRIIIDSKGNVTMLGSKTSGGKLEELELFNGNTFNNIIWNSKTPNNVKAYQSVENITIMKGYGSGLKVVPCFCTKPANTEVANSPTKVGISTKYNKLNNWPENIPNGFIALESSNKGLVINRVANPNQITDAREGMIIYDKTDRCVKLYNGSAWKCIERSCNN